MSCSVFFSVSLCLCGSTGEQAGTETETGYTAGGGGAVDRIVEFLFEVGMLKPETRTGDLNYVNQKYVEADEARAADDISRGLPFADELRGLLAEYRGESTPEAVIAHDADQIEMLLQLKENLDGGSPAAADWTPFVERRLRTDTGKTLARRILEQDSASWWFDRDSEWWVRGGKD